MKLNIKKMKKFRLITVVIALALFSFTACDDSDLPSDQIIEGTYVGTISDVIVKTSLKTEGDAFAEITQIGNQTIQVHLYDVHLDTTFMLNYYEDQDHINVCLTGEDFENMYGHMLGQGHMNGGMMGDIGNNETEWMHHLNDEHQEGDEHFGGFDMLNRTFEYQFFKEEEGEMHEFLFSGVRQ